jgi:thioredoxin 1
VELSVSGRSRQRYFGILAHESPMRPAVIAFAPAARSPRRLRARQPVLRCVSGHPAGFDFLNHPLAQPAVLRFRLDQSMRYLLAVIGLMVALTCQAADPMYSETADAKAEIRQALAQAAKTGVPVLVIFGANWCGDCAILDMAIKHGASAPLVAKEFNVVKVNVGRFDRNVDIAQSYGVPLKNGIPAVAVLSPKNQVVYVTREGELADAQNMGENGIYEFFKKVTSGRKTKS